MLRMACGWRRRSDKPTKMLERTAPYKSDAQFAMVPIRSSPEPARSSSSTIGRGIARHREPAISEMPPIAMGC